MKLIIIQVYSLIRYFTLEEIISRWNILVQICCFDSHHSIWERAGEKKEGGKEEREGWARRREEGETSLPSLDMYWESSALSKPSGCWSRDRWEMTTWLQRVKIYPAVYQVWYVLKQSLWCPTGVNANQIINREAGLDTEDFAFYSCSYFIP